MSRGNRRIGLGVMGFADLLIKLGITYDSNEGLAFAEKVMKFVDDEAWEASRTLAEERGVMPHYEGSRHEARGDRVRNATVTTIAPTGTISIIAGCSGGIEPLFAVAFMRRQADMELPDVNPEFVKLARSRGFYSEDLMKKVAEHGSVRDIPEVRRTSGACGSPRTTSPASGTSECRPPSRSTPRWGSPRPSTSRTKPRRRTSKTPTGRPTPSAARA
jgi:ribonucleoside-diphosphate reductase alpha chain